jgi:hypothetical protein
MDAPTLVHHDDEKLRLVSTGGLLLAHVRQRFTYDEGLEIHAAQEYLRSTVGRHGVLVIISDIRTELSERTRSFSNRTNAEFADCVVCVAHVIEPRGVVGAAVRCIMAGLRAIQTPPYPIRDFSSSRSAAMWTAPLLAEADIELPIGATSGALLEWMNYVRAPDLLDSGQFSTHS